VFYFSLTLIIIICLTKKLQNESNKSYIFSRKKVFFWKNCYFCNLKLKKPFSSSFWIQPQFWILVRGYIYFMNFQFKISLKMYACFLLRLGRTSWHMALNLCFKRKKNYFLWCCNQPFAVFNLKKPYSVFFSQKIKI
jgi:hypothetical protein